MLMRSTFGEKISESGPVIRKTATAATNATVRNIPTNRAVRLAFFLFFLYSAFVVRSRETAFPLFFFSSWPGIFLVMRLPPLTIVLSMPSSVSGTDE